MSSLSHCFPPPKFPTVLLRLGKAERHDYAFDDALIATARLSIYHLSLRKVNWWWRLRRSSSTSVLSPQRNSQHNYHTMITATVTAAAAFAFERASWKKRQRSSSTRRRCCRRKCEWCFRLDFEYENYDKRPDKESIVHLSEKRVGSTIHRQQQTIEIHQQSNKEKLQSHRRVSESTQCQLVPRFLLFSPPSWLSVWSRSSS